MIDAILPESPEARQKSAIILGSVCLVVLGIGVFLLKAGDFESDVKITDRTATDSAGVIGVIQVDVEGAVEAPGVYKLGQGARVEDVLQAAGGLTDEADRVWVEKNVNRAQVVKDGYKLYVPGRQASNNTSVSNASGGVISINSGTQDQLEKLPGIGPVTAGKIISGRPYSGLEELTERKIISAKLWDSIKDLVVLW